MNKSMIVGTVLGAIGVTAAGTMASYSILESAPEYAEVLSVESVTETVQTPREVCHDEVVTKAKPVKDKQQIAGSLIGAVVGGALGNQIGGGNGKKLLTVAAAAAGGYAGKKVQEDMQAKNTYTTTEHRCNTVTETQVNIVGYNVKYQLDGKIDTIRMETKPDKRLPVVDGKLALNQPDALENVE